MHAFPGLAKRVAHVEKLIMPSICITQKNSDSSGKKQGKSQVLSEGKYSWTAAGTVQEIRDYLVFVAVDILKGI